MKIIILGAGSIGTQLARQLVKEDKQVTVIEKNSHRAKRLSNHVDCQVMNIEGNSPAALRESGIENADFFIAVTESDEINMITCSLVTAEFSRPVTIARVRNLDYSTAIMLERPLFGIDYVVNPEIETARVIIRSIEGGAKSNVLFFDEGDLQLCELAVPQNGPFVGKSVQIVRTTTDSEFLIALLSRDNEYLIPAGDTVIKAGDQLFLLGREQILNSVLSANGHTRKPIKKIAIVGGGKICRYIMNDLLKYSTGEQSLFRKMLKKVIPRRNRQIQIIEQNYKTCKLLTQRFPEAIITHADISEEGFMEEGELDGYDLLLAATGNQELNMITGAQAKKLGIPRTISLVQKNSYKNLAHDLGIDVTVSLNNALVNGILKLIRSGNIRSVHTISDSTFEIIEFALEEGNILAGKMIREIKLPRQSLILMVIRDDQQILPGGDLILEMYDRVLIIALTEDIKKLEGIIGRQ